MTPDVSSMLSVLQVERSYLSCKVALIEAEREMNSIHEIAERSSLSGQILVLNHRIKRIDDYLAAAIDFHIDGDDQ